MLWLLLARRCKGSFGLGSHAHTASRGVISIDEAIVLRYNSAHCGRQIVVSIAHVGLLIDAHSGDVCDARLHYWRLLAAAGLPNCGPAVHIAR